MWHQTVGLVNGQYKYLTAETFGFKVNTNGTSMKKKQQWTLEPYPLDGDVNPNDEFAEQEHVAIKSHLNCYLAVDSFGNVTCESEELHPGARFTITICSMTSGDDEQIFWAFRNFERGYFLGASSDGMINCISKVPQSKAELWYVHLIPARGSSMFALNSLGRKRYARAVSSVGRIIGQRRASDGSDDAADEQIQVDSTTAWGSDTLFQFKYYEGGRYALLTSSCKYLTSEGGCIEWSPVGGNYSNNGSSKNGQGNISVTIKSSSFPPNNCLFTIEYHGGSIAFRDCHGRYLAAAGRASVLRTRSSNVSRDELFDFEPAPIQVAFRADFNNRFVSLKQGMDLSANQSEVTASHETFDLQYNSSNDTWNMKTKDGNYWSPGTTTAIPVSSKDKSSAGMFKIKWNDDGTASILATDSSGNETKDPKWVCARKSGQLCLSSNDPVGFHVMFMNRQVINLRPSNGSGFLGLKQLGLGKIECGKTAPDSILVEYVNSETDHREEDIMSTFNCCVLRMPTNGKYLSVVDGNSVAADATSPSCGQQFLLELRSGSTLAIRIFENASYLNLTKQNTLCILKCQPNEATLWEF